MQLQMKASTIKDHFPLLRRQRRLVYLDSAATTQKPACVIKAVNDFYLNANSNVRRGIYELAVKADALMERARLTVAGFAGCEAEQIVFTKNSTEAANLLAYGIGQNRLTAGDNLIVTEVEHHANYLPWQEAARRSGAELRVWPFDKDKGRLEEGWLERNLNERTRVLAVTEMSNVTGYRPDLPPMIEAAHRAGALVVTDGSQSSAHGRPEWRELGVDAAFCTGHKLYGPMGVGVLYMTEELAKELPPLLTGGGMVADLPNQWLPAPMKFEAGTPDVAAICGLDEALRFLYALDWDQVLEKEKKLAQLFREMLLSKPRLNIPGLPAQVAPAEAAAPIISFEVEGIHPHDLAEVLAGEGVCVRAGHHCAKPLLNRLGKTALTRISLGVYNEPSDVEALDAALDRAQKLFPCL